MLKLEIMIPWNKNRKMDDYPQVGFQKGHKGFRNKESYKKAAIKISKANTGKKLPPRSKEEIKKRIETRRKNGWWKNPEKRSEMMKGNKYAYKGSVIKNERNDSAYHIWVKRVKKRDNNKCRINNEDCSGYNIVHHILSWRDYPELRYNINNGITLCQAHHPRKRIDEKRLILIFQELVGSSEVI